MADDTIGWRTFAARADAERLRDALDRAAGYPRTGLEPGGRRVGRGPHAPEAQLRTDHLVGVSTSEDGTQHAVQVTQRADALHGQVVRVGGQDVTIDARTARTATRPFDRAAGDRPGSG